METLDLDRSGSNLSSGTCQWSDSDLTSVSLRFLTYKTETRNRRRRKKWKGRRKKKEKTKKNQKSQDYCEN